MVRDAHKNKPSNMIRKVNIYDLRTTLPATSDWNLKPDGGNTWKPKSTQRNLLGPRGTQRKFVDPDPQSDLVGFENGKDLSKDKDMTKAELGQLENIRKRIVKIENQKRIEAQIA